MKHPRNEIDRLRAVTLGVTDVARSADFYGRIWGLTPVQEREGAVFLRGTGADHHILVLTPAEAPGLVSTTFGTASVEDLHRLYDRLHAAGVPTERPPRELKSPGGGWGFAFHDPEGRVFKVVADRQDHATAEAPDSRPVRLAHVVMNSAQGAATSAFFTDVVGLRLSDRTDRMHFLRCNATHHVIAICSTDAASLNHISFEMASWNQLMFGVGRLKEAGHKVQWGIGRHGPGDNVFAYFLDPDGLAIEYTAEVEQLDDANHVPGTPDQWVRPAHRIDQWGNAEMSAEIKQAMAGFGQKSPASA